ncbi:DNA-binding anti-repressor SinI [Metabacillus litoralis]|uniref:DNA-binding anti-repressor SinI n=1 Tax=Metabacillus litoralis TaxID=152268 RepID=A0A5C6W3A2_9BACI|nr:anti-repressor SinI family protein [Metabacillus litoralis]TXC92379.1 DNA-binding anti-repressor SinI [Metabacillus litoralis]
MSEIKDQLPNEQLDQEWLELIQEAKQIGLSFNDISQFLQGAASTK